MTLHRGSDGRTATGPRSATHAWCASARPRPSGSLRQTMRKRLRRVGASEPFGSVTQFARSSVAAKSPTPSVESAAISIEEMELAGSVEDGAS